MPQPTSTEPMYNHLFFFAIANTKPLCSFVKGISALFTVQQIRSLIQKCLRDLPVFFYMKDSATSCICHDAACAWMGLTQLKTATQVHHNSYSFIVKAEAARKDRQSIQPVATMRTLHCQKSSLVDVCSSLVNVFSSLFHNNIKISQDLILFQSCCILLLPFEGRKHHYLKFRPAGKTQRVYQGCPRSMFWMSEILAADTRKKAESESEIIVVIVTTAIATAVICLANC